LDCKAGIVQDRAIKQLLALERTASKQGKDTIGHPRGGVDDVINAVADACLLARKQRAHLVETFRRVLSGLPPVTAVSVA
jgi:hypothetical protein